MTSTSFVLGVDLDGVCGDYTTAFANVVALERDIDPSSLPAQRGWDFSEWELDDLGGFDAVHFSVQGVRSAHTAFVARAVHGLGRYSDTAGTARGRRMSAFTAPAVTAREVSTL